MSSTEDLTGINGCKRVKQADEKPEVKIILVLRCFKEEEAKRSMAEDPLKDCRVDLHYSRC